MSANKHNITKRQHFISQFLLRHFAVAGSDDKINAYRISGDKLLWRTAIRDQAHQKYFYGDQAIENGLGMIEAAAAPVVRRPSR